MNNVNVGAKVRLPPNVPIRRSDYFKIMLLKEQPMQELHFDPLCLQKSGNETPCTRR